jgi:hypothetical protein
VTHNVSRSAEGPFARWRVWETSHTRTEHHGFVEMPVYSEARIRNIPATHAWVLMPGAPLGLIEVVDFEAVDPFAKWAAMPPIVDTVPPASSHGEGPAEASGPQPVATSSSAWWRNI